MTTNTKQGKLTDDDIAVCLGRSLDAAGNIDPLKFARAIEQRTAAPVEQFGWPKLEKPARVGAGVFGVGVSSHLVVEAAQRHHEFMADPEAVKRAEEAGAALRALIDRKPVPVEPVSDALPIAQWGYDISAVKLRIERLTVFGKATQAAYLKIAADLDQATAEIAMLTAERDTAWAELRRIREAVNARDEESTFDEVAAEIAKRDVEIARMKADIQWARETEAKLTVKSELQSTELTTLRAELAKQTGVQELVDALEEISLSGMSLPMAAGGDEDGEQKMRFHSSQAWKFIAIATNAIAKYKGANNEQ